MITTNDPRYPIGIFKKPESISADDREEFIAAFATIPHRMREAIAGLDEKQLDTPYREGGWTVRQVVHHLPDSHMNAYIRFRLALTEDNPTIRPYMEERWAELADEKSGAIDVSLALLENVHARMVMMFKAMSELQWTRTFFHPEKQKTSDLSTTLAMYVWHSNHHLAHITSLREKMGW